MGNAEWPPISGKICCGPASKIQQLYKHPAELFFISDFWSSNTVLI